MDFELVQSKNLIPDNLEKDVAVAAKNVVETLKSRGMHIAIAESCTGGLVAKTITDVPGASNVFECGIVSYSCDIKSKLLGVDKVFLDLEGPINPETAAQMAEGVRSVAAANIGVSTTGVAGPGPDGEHPEGEIYIGLSDGKNAYVLNLETNTRGQREQNREIAMYSCLKLAEDYLQGGITLG